MAGQGQNIRVVWIVKCNALTRDCSSLIGDVLEFYERGLEIGKGAKLTN